jgi:hypothetical protein
MADLRRIEDGRNLRITEHEKKRKVNMANPNVKPPVVNMGKGPRGEDLPDFDKWDKIQTGFAPYWWPEVGKWCFGRVVAKDIRNPDHIRYLMIAGAEHDCRRGPKNEDEKAGAVGEAVVVKKGDTFSFSAPYSLADEMDFHLWLLANEQTEINIRVLAEKKTKTNHPSGSRFVWHLDVRNDPEFTPLLNSHRPKFLQLKGGGEDRPQIGESAS